MPFMVALAAEGFEIPYSPFDMEFLGGFFQDLFEKIGLGATIGLAGFLIMSGLYILIGYVRGLMQ